MPHLGRHPRGVGSSELWPLHSGAGGGCGGSCQGVRVELMPDEMAGIREVASKLDVSDPIEDDALRREGGSCVFLDPDQRCRIHSGFRADAKPWVCRQRSMSLSWSVCQGS